MELAAYAAERIRTDPRQRFHLAFEPSFSHVCFWWVPPELRPLRDWSAPAAYECLQRITPALKDRMVQAGTTLLGYQPLASRPHFLRLLFINPAVTRGDVDATLELLDRHGREYFTSRGAWTSTSARNPGQGSGPCWDQRGPGDIRGLSRCWPGGSPGVVIFVLYG